MENSLKGYKNSGWENTGSLNAGDGNSGDYNLGNYNSGHRNYGNYNSGDFNAGHSNAGDWNLTDGCGGVFSTMPAKINFFDKASELTLEEWRSSQACQILSRVRTTKWVPRSGMSLAERIAHSEYKQTGGYLKTIPLHEACRELWSQLSPGEKQTVVSMPNFDPLIFGKITGIEL